MSRTRNLRIEQFEQRVLLAITGPELVAIFPDVPNVGDTLEEGEVLNIAPQELLVRFSEGQTIEHSRVTPDDPAGPPSIYVMRSVNGTLGDDDDALVEFGWIGGGLDAQGGLVTDQPNEVILRFAETLPDDLYRIVIVGSGDHQRMEDGEAVDVPPLTNTDAPPLPFNDGVDLTREFELDLGAQVVAVVPQPVTRPTALVTPPDPSMVAEGDTFTVSDGTTSIDFEFEKGDGLYAAVPVDISASTSADDVAEAIRLAVQGEIDAMVFQNLTVSVDTVPDPDRVVLSGDGPRLVAGTLPMAVRYPLAQDRHTIKVYFNEDVLDADLATDPRFYVLFDTNDTFATDDDTILLPTTVAYDDVNHTAVLDFGGDLPDATYRLQIGTSDESNETLATAINVGSLFNTTDFSQVAFVGDADGSDDVDLYRVAIAAAGANLDVDVTPDAGLDPAIRLFDSTGAQVVMINAFGAGAAETLSMWLPMGTFYVGISSSGNVAYTPADGLGNTGGTTSGSYLIEVDVDNFIDGSDDNSSFDTGTDLGTLGTAEQRFRRQIEPQGWLDLPRYPGGSDEPGHRGIPHESHGAGAGTFTSTPGNIGVLPYNFASVYGTDSQGNTLYNQINEDQKDRAREIFEMYASLFGFEVRETASSGLRVVTGDIRALAPTYPPGSIGGISGGGMVIMNAMMYGDPAQDVFGGGWMSVALHEIGHSIGLGHSYDVRSTMGAGKGPEDFYPGQADVIHAQRIHRLDAIDIDMYEFAVTEAGVFTAETIAERLTYPDNSSLLNTALRLYRLELDGSRTLIAQNDDYFSNDSYIELALVPGTYYVGVSSTGNTDYDPTISDSGFGGLTDGTYDLKLGFAPGPSSSLLDATATVFDGDNDGEPGGAHEFFFRSDNTIFVDKTVITNLKQAIPGSAASQTVPVDDVDVLAATPDVTVIKVDGEEMLVTAVNPATDSFTVTRGHNGTPITSHSLGTPVRLAAEDGSLAAPYGLISSALAAASRGDIIRIVGNAGADGDILEVQDNRPYLIGLNTIGLPLEDGSQFQIPRDVVVEIDAGAILKLQSAVIDAGTSDQLLNRQGGALQVLGTPNVPVLFTSYADDAIGGDSNGAGPAALPGDWGGLVFRRDSDFQDPSADPADPGIFLNYVNQAELTFGGGSVDVDSIESVYAPIHLSTTRPTVTNNLITKSADAAVSANPDAFDDSRGRIGPTIHGNTVVDNTVNGVFLRIATEFGEPVDRLSVTSRFDDTDIVHVITESLEMVGNAGGPINNNEVQELSIAGDPTGGNFTLTFIDGARTSLAAGIDALATTLLVNSTANFPATPFDIQVGSEGMTVTGATATTFTVVRGTRDTTAQAHGPGTFITEAHTTDTLPPDATIFDIRTALSGLLNLGTDNVSVTGGPLPTDPVRIEFIGDLRAANQPTLFVHDMVTGAKPEITTIENGGQRIVARASGRLRVDPGIVVKLSSSRIEGLRGNSHLIAEGTEDDPVVFTSLHDDRFGMGGTFDTSNNGSGTAPAKGDWGGLIFNANSRGSIDRALIAFAGGQTPIAGGFANFSAIEVHHNAHVRLANSTLTNNDDLATGGNRDNRGGNDASLIFVRQAQPIIVNNVFKDNDGNVISINANAMLHTFQRDTGRSTGALDAFDQFADNQGPLVRLNRMTGNGTNGMNLRAEVLTNESVWDDTDIVHVLRGEITVDQHHTYSGLRLESAVDQSLVVKLWGASAGFTADGIPLDIDDRIGGTVQVVGQPGFPVILTSLADDSVGASFDPDGYPQRDTNNNGPSTGSPGQWRSLLFEKYSNDRNVRVVLEPELANNDGIDLNNTPFLATFLGELAPNRKSGDENRVLGFEVHGHVSADDPGDVDVYSFKAPTGTEVWIDVDRTRGALDTVVELIQSNGTVLARSTLSDVYPGDLSANLTGSAQPLAKDEYNGGDYYTLNHHDAGFRVVLPGPAGQSGTYFVRVRSDSPDLNVLDGGLTRGEYQLQVRLQQRDEKPGSTVRFADIRYPVVGIDVRGLPAHSPLLGESDETTAGNQDPNGAQNLGNLLETDLNTISFSGELSSSGDYDFYRFNTDYAYTELRASIQAIGGVNAGGKTWATVFDLDYADGLTRGDTTMIVFDASGTPILIGRESNIRDDQPAPGQGNDLDDLTRGTVGKLDPFIGTVQLPTGTPSSSSGTEYYVAVSANGRLLLDLDQFYREAATNTDIRLEPINSVDRIIEDHIGFQGYRSNGAQVDPVDTNGLFNSISSAQALSTYVREFDLSDVLLYVSQSDDLWAVNPLSGQRMYDIDNDLVGDSHWMRDVVMRSDGQLYGYQRRNNTDDTAGRLVTIDHANGALVTVGDDNIDGETPARVTGGNNPGDVDFDDLTVTDDVGALTFERDIDGDNPVYWGWYSVFENGYDVTGAASVNSKLYRFNAGTGAAENDVANNRDSGFGDIQYADVAYAWGNLIVSDGSGGASVIRIQARAPGAAGNGITINVHRGNYSTAVNTVTFGGVIDLYIDNDPNPNAQAIVDRLNDDDSRSLITAARTTSENDAASGAPIDGTIVTLAGGADSTLYDPVLHKYIRGNVTGLAFATAEPNDNAPLYAITTDGEFLRIPAAELNGRDTRLDADLIRDFKNNPPAGLVLANYDFQGLALGPQNLHGGLFRNTLFAINRSGQLIAFKMNAAGTDVEMANAFGSDNEQQVVQLTSGVVNATDSFTLTFTSDRFGQFTTAPIPATATATQVRNALRVLSTPEGVPIIAPADVLVTGAGLATGFTIQFRGFFQDKDVALLSVNNTGMASGAVGTFMAIDPISLLPIQGGDGTRDQFWVNTQVANPTGLAFAPVDVNLWHPTSRRGTDSGHGIDAPYDLSRTPGDERRTHQDGNASSSNSVYNQNEGQGGVSFYFGLEEHVNSGSNPYLNYQDDETQLGILDEDFQRDLTHTSTIGNNYDLPGGAYGCLITDPFDLVSSTGSSDADDRPTLYFNYWLQTDGTNNGNPSNGEMKDSARVYLSSDGGRTWNLLATNNTPKDSDSELPTFLSHSRFADVPDGRQRIQELYETSNWRQARVDLSDFVGKTDLILRFDYSTAGTIIDAGVTTRHTDLDTPQDGFGDLQGDGTRDFQRAQTNAYEGFYLDDIIIGWSERGEMITDANADATGYFQVPTDPDPEAPQLIEDGPYQVEIRRGFEHAANVSNTDPEISVAFTLDPNVRLISTDQGDVDLGLPARGDDFESGGFSGLGWVPNGQGSLAAWTVEPGTGVGGSFAAHSGAIGNNETSLMQVTVTTGAGNVTFMRKAVTEDGKDFFRVFVDEIGENPAEHEFSGSDADFELVSIPVAAGVHTFYFQFFKDATDPVGGVPGEGVIIDDISFPVAGGRVVGDKNLERAQGAFHIESNFVRDVEDVGIRIEAGTRESTSGIEDDGPSSSNPTPGSPINFDTQNTRRFAPGVVIQNNVIAGFGNTGIHFAGESSTAGGVPAAAVPIGKIINNTIVGNVGTTVGQLQSLVDFETVPGAAPYEGMVVSDQFQATHGVRFYYEDGNFPVVAEVGVPQVAFYPQDTPDPSAAASVGQFFLTDYDLSIAVPASPLIVEYSPPTAAASGVLLDMDGQSTGGVVVGDEQWTIEALNASGQVLQTVVLTAGDPGTGNALATPWAIDVGSAVISRIRFTPTGTKDLSMSGFAMDNFYARGVDPQGTGIVVTDGAAPIVLNNILANAAVGVSTAGASNQTVLGRNFFHGNANNGTTGNNPILDPAGNPLFVNPTRGNFYLTSGAEAIDRSLGSLPDLPAFVSVKTPLGIPSSDAFSPGKDLFGQPRVDDPGQPPSGLGNEVFNDLGAIERADTSQPTAAVIVPKDQGLVDDNPALNEVRVLDERMTEFVVQLSDIGVGVADLSVFGGRVHIWKDLDESTFDYDDYLSTGNPPALVEDADYLFRYDEARNRISLVPTVGFWPQGSTYTILLDNTIRDLSGNPLLPTGFPDPLAGLTVFKITLAGWDYGDAPDTPWNTYPSRFENDGARHMTNTPLFLGDGMTQEDRSLHNADASGDLLDDGVHLVSALWIGNKADLTVTASTDGVLNAWIDFNGDGDWDDSWGAITEQVFTDQPLVVGDNLLQVTVPDETAVGLGAGELEKPTFARFRFSSETGLGYTGFVRDGEVEDYQWRLLKYREDYGDAPDEDGAGAPWYPTLAAQNGASHFLDPAGPFLGASVDPELDGQPDATATGDDNDLDGDDEDGIVLPTVFISGEVATIDVDMRNSPADGLLHAWIDFNQDGDWSDAGEQVLVNQPLTKGDFNPLPVNVPATAMSGMTFARFRVTSSGKDVDGNDLSYDGLAADGEVEDYEVRVTVPPVADPNGPYDVYEGSDVTLYASASYDPDGIIVSFEWDLDNDGQYDDATGETAVFNRTDDGVYTVGLRVTDDFDAVGEATTTVTVHNVPPTADPNGPYTVNEGSDILLDGSGSSDPGLDIDSYEWDFDYDGVTFNVDETGPSPIFSAAIIDGPTTRAVGLRVTDDDLAFDIVTTTVTVDGVPPQNLAIELDQAVIDEDGTVTLTGTFDDPGILDTFVVHIDWGDGSTPTDLNLVAGERSFTAPHQYLDDNPTDTPSDTYTVVVLVQSDDDGYDIAATMVTVDNVAPHNLVLDVVPIATDEGTSITLTGTFDDPGTEDTFVVQIDWGDGSTPTVLNLVAGERSFEVPHQVADDSPTATPSDLQSVSVTITDDDTGADADAVDVTIANVAPDNVALALDQPVIDEDGFVTLSGTFEDPGTLDTFEVEIDWGDGSAAEFLSLAVGDRGFTAAHQYLDDDPTGTPSDVYTITAKVTDDDTGLGTSTVDVTVDNVAPDNVVLGLDWAVIDEDGSVTLSGIFEDPGTLDTFEVEIDWGDGSAAEFLSVAAGDRSFTATHQYLDDDPTGTPSDVYTITARVTDDDTGLGTGTVDVTVNNVAPDNVALGLDQAVIDENGFVTLSGTFEDPGTLDTFEVEIDWGDGSAAEIVSVAVGDRSFTATRQYLDDDPSGTPSDVYTITAKVTDDDTGLGTSTVDVTVDNVAPDNVALGLDQAVIDEDGSVTLSGTFQDPGTPDTFEVEIDWGDGSALEFVSVAAGDRSFTAAHQYLDDDPTGTPSDVYTITARVTDDDTGLGTGTVDVTVDNVAPMMLDISADQPVDEGDTLSFSGSFMDPGSDDTHTITWDFGDGGTASDTLTPNHVYADDGLYTVTLTVEDDDTGVDAVTLPVTVLNVAPTAEAGGPYYVDEGGEVTLDASGSTDPGNDIALYEWDLDGDGLFGETGADAVGGDEIGINPTFLAAGLLAQDSVVVALRVTDESDATGEDTATVQVVKPLGPVDFLELYDLDPSAADLWYSLETAHPALLTIASSDAGGTVTLYDENVDSLTSGGDQRVDWQVGAGERYYFTLSGTGSDVDLVLANLVSHVGTQVTVYGTGGGNPITSGNDEFTFDAAASRHVTINGVPYHFEDAEVTSVAFDGSDGDDSVVFLGSSDAERVVMRHDRGTLTGNGYTVSAIHVESITAHSGGGRDVAVLYDFSGNDAFVGGPSSAQLTFENGAAIQANDFRYAYAYANGGGNDTATLSDQAGTVDALVATPAYAILYGSTFYNRATGFEQVTANATAGERNIATLYDSPGDDTFTGGPDSAQLTFESGAVVQANDFRYVTAQAKEGGNDTATLSDQAGTADTLVATPAYAILQGSSFYNRATGFDQVTANATPGEKNVAKLVDSSGNDIFTSAPGSAQLTFEGGGLVQANDFQYVYAYAQNNGDDTATLSDQAGTVDTLVATPAQAILYGSSFYSRAIGFEHVTANATAGERNLAKLVDSSGNDSFTSAPDSAQFKFAGGATVEANDFQYVYAYAKEGGIDTATLNDQAGTMDSLLATPAQAILYGSSFYSRAIGFEHVTANATAGEKNVAKLVDSSGSDTFTGGPDSAQFTFQSGGTVQANNFPYVYTYASTGDGHTDTAYLFDSANSKDVFTGTSTQARLEGPSFFHRATGFEQVIATATAGVGFEDTASLYGTAGPDAFEASPDDATLMFNGSETVFVRASHFASVCAYGGGGLDGARLTGSDQSADVFVGKFGDAKLYSDHFYNRAIDFTQVVATAASGVGQDVAHEDFAWIYDSPAADFFMGAAHEGTLRIRNTDFFLSAYYFDKGYAVAEDHDDYDLAYLHEDAIYGATPWEPVGDWESVQQVGPVGKAHDSYWAQQASLALASINESEGDDDEDAPRDVDPDALDWLAAQDWG